MYEDGVVIEMLEQLRELGRECANASAWPLSEAELGQALRIAGEEGDWVVRIAADGLPEFVPPAFVDPDRTPRRNIHHHRP